MRNACRLAVLVLGAGVLAGGGGGCVVIDSVKEGIVPPPSAEVVAVEVVEETSQGVAVEAEMALTNPNDFELEVEGVDVVFALADGPRFAAPSPAMVVLTPNGTQTMRVRAALPVRRGGGGVDGVRYTVSVTTRWVPPGEVRAILTDSGVPLPFVVARGQGVLGAAADAKAGIGVEVESVAEVGWPEG